MRNPQPPKSFAQLALLEWVCEAPHGHRLFTRGDHGTRGGSPSHVWLYEVGPKGPDGRPTLRRTIVGDDPALTERLGGRPHFDTHQLYSYGLFRLMDSLGHSDGKDRGAGRKTFEEFVAGFETNPFYWRDTVYVPTRKAYEFWESQGRPALAAMRAEREAERARVSRQVVIGFEDTVRPSLPEDLRRLVPEGMPLPLPARKVVRAFAVAEVVRETGSRLYVRDVRRLGGGSWPSWSDGPVQGRNPERYVSKSDVLLDNATWTDGVALAEIDDEYARTVDAAAEQAVRAMLPALTDMRLRMLQGEAQRDDMMREALAARGTRGRDDSSPEDAGTDAPKP